MGKQWFVEVAVNYCDACSLTANVTVTLGWHDVFQGQEGATIVSRGGVNESINRWTWWLLTGLDEPSYCCHQ